MTPYDTQSSMWVDAALKGDQVVFSPFTVNGSDDTANIPWLGLGQSPLGAGVMSPAGLGYSLSSPNAFSPTSPSFAPESQTRENYFSNPTSPALNLTSSCYSPTSPRCSHTSPSFPLHHPDIAHNRPLLALRPDNSQQVRRLISRDALRRYLVTNTSFFTLDDTSPRLHN